VAEQLPSMGKEMGSISTTTKKSKNKRKKKKTPNKPT
jgi:hypothetical protein